MAEMKSCPFCKGQNINIIACYDDACENVYCEGCDKVRYTVVCNAQRGGCGAICGWKATKEDAINSWNIRTPNRLTSEKYPHCVLCGNGAIFTKDLDEYDKLIASISNEAIKEFADRLCEGRVSNDPVVIAVKVELEMVGDTE